MFAAVLATYVLWNVYWVSHGRLPPSMLVAISGLPAPTTGGWRAIEALVRGDWLESLRYNALALPLAGLFAVTLFQLLYQAIGRRGLALGSYTVWAWSAVLALAWVVKLCGDPRYW